MVCRVSGFFFFVEEFFFVVVYLVECASEAVDFVFEVVGGHGAWRISVLLVLDDDLLEFVDEFVECGVVEALVVCAVLECFVGVDAVAGCLESVLVADGFCFGGGHGGKIVEEVGEDGVLGDDE